MTAMGRSATASPAPSAAATYSNLPACDLDGSDPLRSVTTVR